MGTWGNIQIQDEVKIEACKISPLSTGGVGRNRFWKMTLFVSSNGRVIRSSEIPIFLLPLIQ